MPVFTTRNGKEYRYSDYQKSNLVVCYIPDCESHNATVDWLSQLEDTGVVNQGTRCYAKIYTCRKHLNGFEEAKKLFKDFLKETYRVVYITKEEFLQSLSKHS